MSNHSKDAYYNRIDRALEFIERTLFGELSIEELAAVAYMSPFHFHRLFQALVGDPVMEYIKRRRLSSIVSQLRDGMPVVEAAFLCGYASHEAFTRAFKQCYGLPPSKVARNGAELPPYPSMAGKLDRFDAERREPAVEGPAIVRKAGFTIVGITHEVTIDGYRTAREIMTIWKELRRSAGRLPAAPRLGLSGGFPERGVALREGDRFSYTAGIESGLLKRYPVHWDHRYIPPFEYAVFTYLGPQRRVRDLYDWIYGRWLIESGTTLEGDFSIERVTDRGGVARIRSRAEVWVPLRPFTEKSDAPDR